MKALKVCTYIVALAVAIGFYIKSDQLVKKMGALDQTAYASAPLVPGASQSSAPVTEPAQPAPVPAAPVVPAPVAAKPDPKPEPVLLPGAGASVSLGGAPDCARPTGLTQAVNPNSRATGYSGQLLIGKGSGEKLVPCTQARSFGNRFVSVSFGKLQPGTYELPYGTLKVHSRR